MCYQGQYISLLVHVLCLRCCKYHVVLSVQVPFKRPPLLPLVWQGMQSMATSAALDEMFGAFPSAQRGYARAAALAWLLSHYSAPGAAAVEATAEMPAPVSVAGASPLRRAYSHASAASSRRLARLGR